MPTGERGIAIRRGQQKSPRLAGFRGLSRGMRTSPDYLADEEGFEPPCRVAPTI